MDIPSLLRLEEYRAFSGITLSGRVLDLGGDRKSNYLTIFNGEFKTTTVNYNTEIKPDIIHDLEQSLPIAGESFDHVLLINVLEHIFEYRALLREATRVLSSGGSIIVVAPFLFPIHPSPKDYHRFTADTLRREMEILGLKEISVIALGTGVFSAQYLLLDRLMPRTVRFINFYTFRYVAYVLDALFGAVARVFGKSYSREDYALSYCVVAHKF